MGILPDWMIARDVKIDNAAEGVKREGKISYGYTSYGYDARIGYVFDVFSPISATEVDPKNFDKNCLVRKDFTPRHQWEYKEWESRGRQESGEQCIHCGAWKGTPSEHGHCNQSPYILIPPHSFVLGETIETFTIPRDTLCVVVGKSTYARCGLIVNVTPGEPEWTGKWTVEISNTTPLPARVYCGEGIMQCLFFRTDGYTDKLLKEALGHVLHIPEFKAGVTCRTSYADKKGRYQGQTGVTAPSVDQK
jgi:dCTP deaminase